MGGLKWDVLVEDGLMMRVMGRICLFSPFRNSRIIDRAEKSDRRCVRFSGIRVLVLLDLQKLYDRKWLS